MSSYGCFDRPPYKDLYTVHGISKETGLPVSTTIPFRMARDCQYSLNDQYDDPNCKGCKHDQGRPQKHSQEPSR